MEHLSWSSFLVGALVFIVIALVILLMAEGGALLHRWVMRRLEVRHHNRVMKKNKL